MIATAIDMILVLVVVEGLVLAVVRHRTGRGVPLARIAPMLAAGFFLMLATRLVLAGAGAAPIAACLLGSLVAHLADLAGRWNR